MGLGREGWGGREQAAWRLGYSCQGGFQGCQGRGTAFVLGLSFLWLYPPKDGMTVWKWLPGSPVTVFWKTAQPFLQRYDRLMCDLLCWLEYVGRKNQTPHRQKFKWWNSHDLPLLSFLYVAALLRWNGEALSSYQTWRLFVNALRMFHGLNPRAVKDRDFDSSDKWRE